MFLFASGHGLLGFEAPLPVPECECWLRTELAPPLPKTNKLTFLPSIHQRRVWDGDTNSRLQRLFLEM